jgi:acetolactate synthase-1/2/3 large subunit
MQKQDHGGRVIGSNLHNPEFAKMAETFGATGVLVNGPADLEPALREAFARSGPTIIEVRVGEMSEPWRHILMPKVR